MLQMLQDYWAAFAGSTAVGSVLSWIGVDTVRSVRRHEREKADRSEVTALVQRVEDGHTALLARIDKSHDTLLSRIDKSIDDGSASRKIIHEKIEKLVNEHHSLKLEVAGYARQNGNHK